MQLRGALIRDFLTMYSALKIGGYVTLVIVFLASNLSSALWLSAVTYVVVISGVFVFTSRTNSIFMNVMLFAVAQICEIAIQQSALAAFSSSSIWPTLAFGVNYFVPPLIFMGDAPTIYASLIWLSIWVIVSGMVAALALLARVRLFHSKLPSPPD